MAGKSVSKRFSGIASYILVAKPPTSFRFQGKSDLIAESDFTRVFIHSVVIAFLT